MQILGILISKRDIKIIGKCYTNGLDDATLAVEKEYSINFIQQEKKLCSGLHYNGPNR